jgi:tetratricopeptide (TPR) repeat protein
MSIKFNCPHCQKPLNVKDQLAGKRALCPGCKKPLTVPAPTSQPADIEAFAAAALVEQPEEAAPPVEQKTMEVVCSYCDTKFQVSVELEGKQTPCPDCRRIVKVPLLEKKDPKDWRKVETRLPAGARQNLEPAPEGTWSTRSAGVVSREALVEAQAIPQVKERLTWQQWAKRGTAAAVVLAVAGLTSWLVLKSVAQGRQTKALAKAFQLIDGKKLTPEAAAEVHRFAGDYYLRAGNAEEASNQFKRGRAAVQQPDDTRQTERDFALTDLLLAQVELAGEKLDVEKKTRLKWDDVQKELRQTWQYLHTPEGRVEGMRALARVLAAKGQAARAVPLASQVHDETPELLAVIGLEVLRANQDVKTAEELANQAQRSFPVLAAAPAAPPVPPAPPKPGAAQPKGPPPAPSLIALWLALGKSDKLNDFGPPPGGGKPTEPAVLVGYVEGLARHGEWEQAQRLARGEAFPPEDRLPALLALAEVALERGKADVGQLALKEALSLLDAAWKKKPGSPWLLYRLVRAAVQAGLEEQAENVAKAIPDAGLRGRAQLEILRSRLANTKGHADDALAQKVDKSTPAHGLALEAVERHNVQAGGGAAVDAWEPEALRAFGYVGTALGLQDNSK